MIRITIPGVIPSLKNEKELGRSRTTGKANMRNAALVQKFIEDFQHWIPRHMWNLKLGSKKQHLRADIRLYAESWKRDADVEVLYDCLQYAGVVSNDRWIRMKFVDATRVDPNNPRAEIELRELAPQ